MLSSASTLSVSLRWRVFGFAIDDARRLDAAVRAAIGQAAGQRDRLRDGHARLDDEGARIAHLAGDVEALRLRHEHRVAVLQVDVLPGLSELQVVEADADAVRVLVR